jgi:hypothetical protein
MHVWYGIHYEDKGHCNRLGAMLLILIKSFLATEPDNGTSADTAFKQGSCYLW